MRSCFANASLVPSLANAECVNGMRVPRTMNVRYATKHSSYTGVPDCQ